MTTKRGDFDADEECDKELLRTLYMLRGGDDPGNDLGTNEFNRNHPERADDEVWYTNSSDKASAISESLFGNDGSYDAIDWNTKRRGNISYDAFGEVLGEKWSDSFPVFIKQSEVLEREPESLQRMLPGCPTC